MKWNANDIIVFLNVYQQYPKLWNLKDKYFCNSKLKEDIFQQLFDELVEKQLIGEMNVKQLKAKIKTIKDVYRQELHKIENSKKSGCGTDEIYCPKLAWFNAANYLADVVSTRRTTLNLVQSQNSPDPDEVSECTEENFQLKSPTTTPSTQINRVKKRAVSEESLSEISEAIQQLDRIAQNAAEEKPYDQFGKFIASELRHLPQRDAILLQQEIHNIIIQAKLSALEQVDYFNSEIIDGLVHPKLEDPSDC